VLITLRNINFQNSFTARAQRKICNKMIITNPTTPERRCCTTPWNRRVSVIGKFWGKHTVKTFKSYSITNRDTQTNATENITIYHAAFISGKNPTLDCRTSEILTVKAAVTQYWPQIKQVTAPIQSQLSPTLLIHVIDTETDGVVWNHITYW